MVKPLGEDEQELDEAEMETLREAGIIPKAKRKGRKPKATHIVFAEDEAEGKSILVIIPVATKPNNIQHGGILRHHNKQLH